MEDLYKLITIIVLYLMFGLKVKKKYRPKVRKLKKQPEFNIPRMYF